VVVRVSAETPSRGDLRRFRGNAHASMLHGTNPSSNPTFTICKG
jgi:hypothetical protein